MLNQRHLVTLLFGSLLLFVAVLWLVPRSEHCAVDEEPSRPEQLSFASPPSANAKTSSFESVLEASLPHLPPIPQATRSRCPPSNWTRPLQRPLYLRDPSRGSSTFADVSDRKTYWIYMHGDSLMRHMFAELISILRHDPELWERSELGLPLIPIDLCQQFVVVGNRCNCAQWDFSLVLPVPQSRDCLLAELGASVGRVFVCTCQHCLSL
mmetsp:Transcript_44436/g.111959  ORF Transcript_44436/g.111959 Transcript_44436/m.111959 type:complete len:210 (+) Transcript_44436:221-850(+)